MMRTYVVTKDMDSMGRKKVIYAGQDADRAKEIRDDRYDEEEAPIGKRVYATFIEVWEDGEHQFTTREHPEAGDEGGTD